MVNIGVIVGIVIIAGIIIFLLSNRGNLKTLFTQVNSKLKTTLTGKPDLEKVPDTTKTITTKDNVQTKVQTVVFTTKTGGTRVVKNADQGLIERLNMNFADFNKEALTN